MVIRNKMEQKLRGDEVLRDLSEHISWCLSQYPVTEDVQLDSEEMKDEGFHPDWSALRTLQNHLHYFLGHEESEQSSAVATLLVFIIGRIFSDLCTDTPWDDRCVINNARRQAHNAVMKLLTRFKSGVELTREDSDKVLWEAFREFEKEYSKILSTVNEKDLGALEPLINVSPLH